MALKRRLSLPLTTFFGLGTILGAGIYVLVGKVAGEAGLFAPIAFLLAAVVAGFTACSYGELASRIPKAAAEAHYIDRAFDRRWLTVITGWLVAITGVVSAATIVTGSTGYVMTLLGLPEQATIIGVVLVLTAIAVWGIRESAWLITLFALLEVGGLLFVLFFVGEHFTQLPARMPELMPAAVWSDWLGIVLGAFLAFYAFIGFEDMVNVAEEVKEPNDTLPKAILISLVVATLLYVAVALGAVLSLPAETLAQSKAPLADMVALKGEGGALGRQVISAVSIMVVLNGALAQIIMASRVLYGMGHKKGAPAWCAEVHPKTHTPHLATLLVGGVIMVLALGFPLKQLAELTSFVILVIFILMNLSLLRLKQVEPDPPLAWRVPNIVPVTGGLLSLGMLGFKLFH